MLCLWILNYLVSHTIDEEYLKDDTNKNWSHNRHMLIINLWNSINDVFAFTEIDECVSNPCESGSTCNNYVNSFNCTCTEGYTGMMCETGNLYLTDW